MTTFPAALAATAVLSLGLIAGCTDGSVAPVADPTPSTTASGATDTPPPPSTRKVTKGVAKGPCDARFDRPRQLPSGVRLVRLEASRNVGRPDPAAGVWRQHQTVVVEGGDFSALTAALTAPGAPTPTTPTPCPAIAYQPSISVVDSDGRRYQPILPSSTFCGRPSPAAVEEIQRLSGVPMTFVTSDVRP